MKKIFIGLLSLISFYSWAQVSTIKVNPTESFSGSNGIVYALPKATFRVDVWIEKADHLQGPYTNYASKLLGVKDVISSDYSTYKIKDIKVSTEYTSDSDQLYYMDLGEISGKTSNIKLLKMNEAGIFGGMIAEESEEAAEINGRLIEEIKKGNRNFRYFADANLIDKVDTIIRRVDVDTSTIEKAILKRYSIEKDLQQRAQDAATNLMEIRKNRFELISGYQEVAYSEGALSLMNKELKQMEDDYLALFTGKTLLSDQHYVFYFTPSSDQPNIISPVFKFSGSNGIASASGGTGEKVSIAIKSHGLSEKMSDISVNGNIPGIVYRFPESAEVWVKYGVQEYDKQIITIPQFGKLQKLQLNNNIFELHPTTGGLKLLEVRK